MSYTGATKMISKIKGTTQDWESGKLGRNAEHAIEASLEEELALDDALELKLISIRLQKSLIKKLKLIANYRGIGYQPLVRDVLSRFVGGEFINIMQELEAQKKVGTTLSGEDSLIIRQIRKA
jgi:predicted DNA binding CopG/RHH family protein